MYIYQGDQCTNIGTHGMSGCDGQLKTLQTTHDYTEYIQCILAKFTGVSRESHGNRNGLERLLPWLHLYINAEYSIQIH